MLFLSLEWFVNSSQEYNFFIMLDTKSKICSWDPGQCDSVSWASSCKAKVAGWIPGQSTCLGCGFGPRSGHTGEATNRRFSLTSVLLCLSFSLLSSLRFYIYKQSLEHKIKNYTPGNSWQISHSKERKGIVTKYVYNIITNNSEIIKCPITGKCLSKKYQYYETSDCH